MSVGMNVMFKVQSNRQGSGKEYDMKFSKLTTGSRKMRPSGTATRLAQIWRPPRTGILRRCVYQERA